MSMFDAGAGSYETEEQRRRRLSMERLVDATAAHRRGERNPGAEIQQQIANAPTIGAGRELERLFGMPNDPTRSTEGASALDALPLGGLAKAASVGPRALNMAPDILAGLQRELARVGGSLSDAAAGALRKVGVGATDDVAQRVAQYGTQGADDAARATADRWRTEAIEQAQRAEQTRDALSGVGRARQEAVRLVDDALPVNRGAYGVGGIENLRGAVNPGTVGIGAAAGLGASVVGGGQAGQNQPQQQTPYNQQGPLPTGQASPVAPSAHGPNLTPEQRAGIDAEIARIAQVNAARNAPPISNQGGQPVTSPVPGSQGGATTAPPTAPPAAAPTTTTQTPFSVTPQQQAEIDRQIGVTAEKNKQQGANKTTTTTTQTKNGQPVPGKPGWVYGTKDGVKGQWGPGFKEFIPDGGAAQIPNQGGQTGPGGPGGPGGQTGPGGNGPGGQYGPGNGYAPGSTIQQFNRAIMNDLAGIRSEIANSRAPDVAAIFASQSSGLLRLLEEQEKLFKKQADEEGTQIDPATKFAIDELRESLAEQLKGAREDLNRRGILDSGITLDVESKIRKGQVSSEGRILAERLSRIQNTLRERLATLSNQKIATASNFGMAGAQAQVGAELDERRRRDALYDRLIDAQSRQRDYLAGEERFERGLAAEESRFERGLDFQRQEAQAGREFQSGQQQAGFQFQREQTRLAQEFDAQQNEFSRQAQVASENARRAFEAGQAEVGRQWQAEQNRLDRAAQLAAANATAARQQAERASTTERQTRGDVRDEVDRLTKWQTREAALSVVQENAASYRAMYGEEGYQYLLNVANSLPSSIGTGMERYPR